MMHAIAKRLDSLKIELTRNNATSEAALHFVWAMIATIVYYL